MGSERALAIFDGSQDVGAVQHQGAASYSSVEGAYTVSGAGHNMWFSTDEFHFAYKQISGDISISADIEFAGDGFNAHRKACLIIRQSLEPGYAYADIARHGDGLTSLQYRDEVNGGTHEVQSNVSAPRRVRLDRRGNYITASVLGADGRLEPSGGSVRLELSEPFYVGLGVCSHEDDIVETAVFSNVVIDQSEPVGESPTLYSTLETVAIASTDRRTVRVFKGHVEAPNWTPDGKDLIYNSGGHLYRIAASGGEPTLIDTGFANRCNNDHGLSADGRTIVISDQSQPPHQSIIYTLPIEGGAPKRITEKFPSYWHGWSPDGKTLAYCAQRDGNYGIFTIPVEGGEETRLTSAVGLDDGPDYSPDGKHIIFNSDRTGKMQIWRMNVDGTSLAQLTSDDYNNWFGHISPDGKWMVFLTYGPDVQGHPANKDVMLRLMRLDDGAISVLAKLFGGQGTINVPSWSPDSKQVAFVSYQLLP